jgi:hypothetical protein
MKMKLPAKDGPVTEAKVMELEHGLTSVIAGHPGAIHPWTFYEVLDEYLGPWGAKGYPIGYGKKYCVLFSENEKLRQNVTTHKWVWRTTIVLQEALRDFVVATFRQGKLASLTESQLRQYAFDTHPIAYTKGGLTLVVIVAPELVGEIVSIPSSEFLPMSPNCSSSLRQVFSTGRIVVPELAGMSLAGLAGPAHTGLFAHAAKKDMARLPQEINLNHSLGHLKDSIEHGRLDDFLVLDDVIGKLNGTEFPDAGFARFAREIINSANSRKCVLVSRYKSQANNPAMDAMRRQIGQTCRPDL